MHLITFLSQLSTTGVFGYSVQFCLVIRLGSAFLCYNTATSKLSLTSSKIWSLMYGSIQCPTSSVWVLCWLCQVSSIHFEPSTTSQKHWTLASEIAVHHKVLACSKSVTVESAQPRKCHYSLIFMWEGSGHKTVWQWSGIRLVVFFFFLVRGWGLGTRLLWVQFMLSSHCILPSPPSPSQVYHENRHGHKLIHVPLDATLAEVLASQT